MSATTSRVTATTQFSAPDLITVSASAACANVMTAGGEMLASAAVPSTHVKLQTVKSVRVMGSVVAGGASVKSRRTSDTQGNTARNVQHVQVVVTS